MFELLASAAPAFDVDAASRAYLDTLQGPARAKSDAYFEGGYWLILWAALIAVLADWLILRFRLSALFRSLAEKVSKRAWLVTTITAFLYGLLSAALLLPWTLYTDYFREKQYGLLDQSFGAWASEAAISFAVDIPITLLLVVAVYALIRRAPRTWWLWGTGVTGIFLAAAMLIAPVFIAPLFNDYTEMKAGPLRDRIEAMAVKYEIPAQHIYVFDQSKQHKRISANVSGLGPTIRISLNDNLLERTSDDEVVAVMGHEMGHYVLHHSFIMLGIMLLLTGLSMFAVARLAPLLIARYGERWGVRDIADPASLPVLSILLTLVLFLTSPAINSLVRWAEGQADAFGLEAAREPDAFARVAMRLSEYRKIEPGPIEEFLFFDHPSGAARVRRSMEWKARNVPDPKIVQPEIEYDTKQ